jgi:hypothetical protein
MMSLMSPLTIPADLPVTLETLQNLVSLLANPDATKQRITEMQTATATLQQAIDEQKRKWRRLPSPRPRTKRLLTRQPMNTRRSWQRIRRRSIRNARGANRSLMPATLNSRSCRPEHKLMPRRPKFSEPIWKPAWRTSKRQRRDSSFVCVTRFQLNGGGLSAERN